MATLFEIRTKRSMKKQLCLKKHPFYLSKKYKLTQYKYLQIFSSMFVQHLVDENQFQRLMQWCDHDIDLLHLRAFPSLKSNTYHLIMDQKCSESTNHIQPFDHVHLWLCKRHMAIDHPYIEYKNEDRTKEMEAKYWLIWVRLKNLRFQWMDPSC